MSTGDPWSFVGNGPDTEYNADGDVVDHRDKKIRLLERKVRMYEGQEQREKELRDLIPALDDAWDRYQLILRVVT